jgi:hypothetical protein
MRFLLFVVLCGGIGDPGFFPWIQTCGHRVS